MNDREEPRSFYLPDGRIIFPYICNVTRFSRKWRIGVRDKRGKSVWIQWFKEIPSKRSSEESALADLREYAKQHNLKPAY